MSDRIDERLANLQTLCKTNLNDVWRKLFQAQPPLQLRRDLMARILAYRLQEQAFGVLNPRCQRRLRQLATAIRTDPRAAFRSTLLIKPGTRLVREWQSKTHIVHVGEQGYEYNGLRYDSLSEIARLITGSHRSGPLFFGLRVKQMPSSREVA